MSKLSAIVCIPFGIPLLLAATGCEGGTGSEGPGSVSSTGPGGAGGPGPSGSVGAGTGASCVLVAGNLPISDAQGSMPALVWDAGHYLVAWSSLESDEGDIRLAVLDAEGNKVNDQLVTSSPAKSGSPSITSLPSGGYLVVWQDGEGAGAVVRGRNVDKDGNPEGGELELTTSGAEQPRPVAVASQMGTVVAWMDTSDAYVGFAGTNGTVGSKVALGGTFPTLASADGSMGIAWTKGLGGAPAFARIDAPGDPINPVMLDGQAANPSLAYEGGSFGLAWEDTRAGEEQIQFARVAADGSVVGTLKVSVLSGSANWPDVVWTGTHDAIAYYQFRGGPPAIYLALVDADLQRVGEDLEVSGGVPSRFPSIAWSGKELAIAFAEKDGMVRLSRAACAK